MRLTVLGLLALTTAAFAWPDPDPDPPRAEPIELELVGDKTLTVSRMGLNRTDWIRAVKEGKVAALPSGLKLRIRNNLKTTLKVRVTGSVPVLTLSLKPIGKEGEEVAPPPPDTKAKGISKISYEFIEAGKTLELPLSALQGFARFGPQPVFPSDAGEWKLTAEFTTALYEEGPAGTFKSYKGTLKHTLRTKPLTVHVRVNE